MKLRIILTLAALLIIGMIFWVEESNAPQTPQDNSSGVVVQ